MTELLVPIGVDDEFKAKYHKPVVKVTDEKTFDPGLLRKYAESHEKIEIASWVVVYLLDQAKL